ncbi:MAG: CoA transferase [Tetrasphaera sp.]
MTRAVEDTSAPLAGVLVVSIEQAISGPLATRHLAELGARVIKVESPAGDATRYYDESVHGMSAHFVWLNRGKESVALDLRLDEDRVVLERLLEHADVFVTNMAPGALGRLGFEPRELTNRYPSLIVVDISGFGAGGPLSERRAYDLIVQAESGICSLTGAPGFPVKPGVPAVDIGAALYNLAAVGTALFARTRTGRGAYIPIAMFDVATEMSGFALNQVIHTGRQPEPVPLGTPLLAPYGVYPTRDGHSIVLGATSDREWRRLAEDLMEDPDFASDVRFATNNARIRHRAELDAHIGEWTARHALDELQQKADTSKLGHGRLNQTLELPDHPQLVDRHRWTQATVAGATVPALRAPLVGGDWTGAEAPRVPQLGEDTERVRAEVTASRPTSAVRSSDPRTTTTGHGSTPAEVPIWADMTVWDLFERAVRERPEGEAVVSGQDRLTYRELAHEVHRLAAGLREIGVGRGDRIALWMVNRTEWLVTYFAVAKIGGVLVTLNPRYTASECGHILRTTGSKALVVQDRYGQHDYLDVLRSMVPEVDDGPPGALASPALPALREVIVLGAQCPSSARTYAMVQRLGDNATTDSPEMAGTEASVDDLFLLLFTSGTTSASKGVALTHRNIVANNFASGERQRLTPLDRMLFVLPLPSAFSCAHGLVAILSHLGTFVLLDRFTATGCLELIERERCTSMYGVGSLFQDLIEANDRGDYDLSSLRTGVGILTPDMARAIYEQLGVPEYHNGWGMTESGGVSTMTSPGDPVDVRLGSIGTPLPGVEIIIADPITGSIVEHGEVGEILIRGTSVTSGYYGEPEATAALIDERGWLHSADLGVIDRGGYVRYMGRIKDVIKTDGNSVSPAEVENVIAQIPGVREVAVLGVPDPRSMEIVYAFVVLEAGVTGLDADAIRRECRQRLAGYKVPRHIQVVSDGLPRNDLGKLLRTELRVRAVTQLEGPAQ